MITNRRAIELQALASRLSDCDLAAAIRMSNDLPRNLRWFQAVMQVGLGSEKTRRMRNTRMGRGQKTTFKLDGHPTTGIEFEQTEKLLASIATNTENPFELRRIALELQFHLSERNQIA